MEFISSFCRLLSDHVMSLHTGRKKNNLEKDLVAITTGAGLSQNTIDKMVVFLFILVKLIFNKFYLVVSF